MFALSLPTVHLHVPKEKEVYSKGPKIRTRKIMLCRLTLVFGADRLRLVMRA